jgi:NADH-quinone oxidoreductase subunit J
MEKLAYLAYGLYLTLIAAGALIAVRSSSLVRALIGLITTLFGVAGMYLLMAAPFMALMQILIYVGAVSVLIFFAIMLTRPAGGEAGEEGMLAGGGLRRAGAILSGLLPAAVLATVIFTHIPPALPLKAELSLARLGEVLTGPYVLAFELISVVLVAAMVGAVLLGFERRQG